MLIRMHYSVNNHHVVRSVLEEASLKTRNKSVHKTQCVIIQHLWWKKSEVYFSQSTTGQKLYMTKHSEHTSSHRHHQMSTRTSNVYKKCWFSLFLWNKLLCILQAGRSLVICNDLCKELWMSDISSECPGMQWCNSNCFCSLISIQGRSFDTHYHKFSLVWKIWWHKSKGCQTH